MLKSLLRSTLGLFIISILIMLVMICVGLMTRWRHIGRKAFLKRQRAAPQIIIFWHEHLFVMSLFMPSGCSVLHSPHRDGRVFSRISRLFGVKPLWGSSNRGAAGGLRQMVREIKSGRSVIITPDGPRGPARKLSMGPISLAQLTGAPITLIVWSAKRCWYTSSWDKLRIPKPASAAQMIWSEDIFVPPTKNRTEMEAQRQMIEDRLNALRGQCDQDISS